MSIRDMLWNGITFQFLEPSVLPAVLELQDNYYEWSTINRLN